MKEAFLQSIHEHMKRALFVLLLILSECAVHQAYANTYVTFSDGRLFVFPDTCVQSQTQEDGRLSFTAPDGSVYSYALEEIASIEEMLTKELPIFTSYKFNNKYNYQVYTDAVGTITDDEVNVEVAGIGKRLTASFNLSDENARAYVDGKVQTSKVSRLRFENSRSYVVGYPGDLILTEVDAGKYAMMPFGRTYSVNVDFLTDHSTSVPRIDINTVGSVNITSKNYYVDAEIIIDGAGVFPSMTDSVQIKGRGNDSWSTDPTSKNPYRLKFAGKVKPLGLTNGKNWVLLANKRTGTLLTNAIGMKAASLIGTVAVNHIIPVDLYINGTYKGSYNFTEKVGLANNSVDLDDEAAAALLELDKYYDETRKQKFMSTPYSLPVNIKHPDFKEDSTVLDLDIIRERFNSFLSDVYDGKDYSSHVDMDYLARYLMVTDLICNFEALHPKSVFCYNENLLDENSKFVFGPLWDLDWAFGYNGYFVKYINTDFFSFPSTQQEFFAALRYGSDMGERYYGLWKEFKGEPLEELCEFCQDYYDYAKPSINNNRVANLDATDYGKQVLQAINWIRQRSDYIFEQVVRENSVIGDVNGDGEISIADINVIISIILGSQPSEEVIIRADVNEDKEITVNDVTALIGKMVPTD